MTENERIISKLEGNILYTTLQFPLNIAPFRVSEGYMRVDGSRPYSYILLQAIGRKETPMFMYENKEEAGYTV
jgi:hypothetical protein